MKHFGVLVLCMAVVFSGCDGAGSSGGSSGISIDPVVNYILLGGVVAGVAVGSAIHKSHDRRHHEDHAGLNVSGPRKAKVGEPFQVRTVVADGKRKAIKDWWSSGHQPTWEVATVSGTGKLVEVARDTSHETAVVSFLADTPGTYRVSVRTDALTDSSSTDANEGSVEVTVR